MSVELRHYLRSILDERNLSNRAFAMYAGISEATVRRLLAGRKVDFPTLNKIAQYLDMPPESVYRMAGVLPEQDEKEEIIALISHLFSRLPEADQQEILRFIQFKFQEHLQERTETQPR